MPPHSFPFQWARDWKPGNNLHFNTSVFIYAISPVGAKCSNTTNEIQEPFPNGICIDMPLDGGAVASREPLGYVEDDNPNDKMAGESSMMGSL
jgi:hypothetical protein